MDFYFRPDADAWPDNKLRVAPDLLPPGSVKLVAAWIDDKPYENFDRTNLIVNLPDTDKSVRVRVRIEPSCVGFSVDLLKYENNIAEFALIGELSKCRLDTMKRAVDRLPGIKGMVLDLTNLASIDDTGWNYLLFTKQRAGSDFSLKLKSLNENVKKGLDDAELAEEFEVIG